MTDRTLFRWGSWAAIIGGVIALAGNILHPRLETFEDPVAEEIRIVGESDIWVGIHLGILLGFLLITFGLFAVARSMKGGPGEGAARIALGSLLISAPIAILLLLIEAYATPAIVDVAITGDAAGIAAATAASHIAWAGFMGIVIMALGVTPALFGLAITRDGGYPAWLGWTAFLFGLVSIGAGITGIIDGASSGFFIVFAISSGIVTLWVIAIGGLLGRRGAGPITVPEGTAARGRTSAGMR